jgi:uridine kinase
MVVLAVAGISTCGKSTISRAIASELNYPMICLDRFFKTEFQMPRVNLLGEEVANWELPESLRWDEFVHAIQVKLEESPRVLVIEGFILFADPRVIDLAEALIAITFKPSEKAVATQRRVSRALSGYPPGLIPEEAIREMAEFLQKYFEDVVWTEALDHPEYVVPIGWQKPTLVLSATDPIESNIQKSLAFMSKLLK